jgi:hypothetical protein
MKDAETSFENTTHTCLGPQVLDGSTRVSGTFKVSILILGLPELQASPRLISVAPAKPESSWRVAFTKRTQPLVWWLRDELNVPPKTTHSHQYANANRRDVQFAVGEWVPLSSKNLCFKQANPKLLPRWVIPFQVVKRVGSQDYELILPQRSNIHGVLHVSVLKKNRRHGSMQPPSPPKLLGGEVEYVVKHILEHRLTRGRGPKPYEYRVKGGGSSE